MYYNENTVIFLDGKFIKENETSNSLYSQTLHYGYGAFEGIRSYETINGCRLFKPDEHYQRLKKSCELVGIPFNYSVDQLTTLTYELLEMNGLTNAYIRPLVFCDPNMSLTKPNNVSLMICAWEWGAYLGDKQLRLSLSSFCRPHPRSMKIEAKICGHYINSILATTEAKEKGFDEALLLDSDGFLAEGPGANLFFEKNGKLFTPQTGNILPGITRSTVLELAREKGIDVEIGHFTLTDLTNADHAFYCGTAAEIVGIESLDEFVFPTSWENSLAKQLSAMYSALVYEKDPIGNIEVLIMKELNTYSKTITQDDTQPAAQAMLYGIGLTEEDMHKAQVGIVSMGYEGNTCNMHLNDLSKTVKEGVIAEDLVGLIFHTIGVSDGISNGTDGMRFSLVSRDLIADSIETVVSAQWYDAVVAVPGCDKNMPGAIMAMGRLNRPALMVYGGSIHSGKWKGESLNIVSAFEAVGQRMNQTLSVENFKGIIKNACPGAGACGGMYTANTMASAIEALGMSLPFSSSNPALSESKQKECLAAGKAIKHLLENDIKPRDIMTKKAFENAITLVTVLGGSTNAVLHLIAMAHSVDIELTLEDFQRISDSVPVLADLKPSGQYLMEDLHQAGGVPAVLKYLLQHNLIHGDCLTVTGKTLRENLIEIPDLMEGQKIILPLANPLKDNGHLQILYGNLAQGGSVAKISGQEGEYFEGNANVFDDEFSVIEAVKNGAIVSGDVVVIRYCGPKGGPGMPEMLKPTSAIMGAGLGKEVALITDGRFSGGSHGFVVGHITPEAYDGGAIALVENGDRIAIDTNNNTIMVHLTAEELQTRKSAWKQPVLKAQKGILYKYAQCVSDASTGCITDNHSKTINDERN